MLMSLPTNTTKLRPLTEDDTTMDAVIGAEEGNEGKKGGKKGKKAKKTGGKGKNSYLYVLLLLSSI